MAVLMAIFTDNTLGTFCSPLPNGTMTLRRTSVKTSHRTSVSTSQTKMGYWVVQGFLIVRAASLSTVS